MSHIIWAMQHGPCFTDHTVYTILYDWKFWIKKGDEEVYYLEDRLGIDHELHFEYNKKKQFNCLSQPVPYCLSDAKGRPSTINKMEALKNEVSILHRYYQPEMEKTFELLFPGTSVKDFCNTDGRFHWLKYYLCNEQRWTSTQAFKDGFCPWSPDTTC